MTSTQFKLSKRDGLTRRITFPDEPDWPVLATTIASLYGIPVDKIGVTYVDGDGDEVTLNSQQELQDFYQDFYPDFDQPSQAIKFIVQDLRSTRAEGKALPQIPPAPDIPDISRHLRSISERKALPEPPPSDIVQDTSDNEGVLLDIEDDWQRVPTLRKFEGVLTPRLDSPPVLDKVTEIDKSDLSMENGNTEDEGNRKAREDVPPTINAAQVGPHISHITSKVAVTALPETATNPPLPSLDSTHAEHAMPFLSNDVATLLNTLTNILTSHPEAFQSILRNASKTTSWNAQREAISEAAEGLAHSVRQLAHPGLEDGAGKRVADALGGMLRTLSQVTAREIANVPPTLSSDTTSTIPTETDHPRSTDIQPPPASTSPLYRNPSLGNRTPQGNLGGSPPPPAHRFGIPSSPVLSDLGPDLGTPRNNPHAGRPSPPFHPNPHENGPSLPVPPHASSMPSMHGRLGSEPFRSWNAPQTNTQC